MIEAIKVVSVDGDGRRLSAMRYRLPDDYVQVYVDAAGATNVVRTSMVFEDIDAARGWIKDADGLEIWSCTCGEVVEVSTLFDFSGMNEIVAFVRAPYDAEEMAALVSGRAVRIWPKVKVNRQPDASYVTTVVSYHRYGCELPIPPGSLLARDVTLVRRVPSV